jgi:hypothetical protein
MGVELGLSHESLRVLEYRELGLIFGPKMGPVTRDWRILHNELRDL